MKNPSNTDSQPQTILFDEQNHRDFCDPKVEPLDMVRPSSHENHISETSNSSFEGCARIIKVGDRTHPHAVEVEFTYPIGVRGLRSCCGLWQICLRTRKQSNSP